MHGYKCDRSVPKSTERWFSLSKFKRWQAVLKGQCHEIFCFWFFSWISFPLAPEYSIETVSIFSKIRGDIRSSRFATGVNDTGGKWKKSSIRKIVIILFGHLWVPIVEETYIKIFTFKFTFSCLQPDIVPIICYRCQWHRWQICRRCRWHRWCTLTSEYLREFSRKF